MISYNPLVSIIIPNYNHAVYLTQRMESVINQSYQNFEIIILDDCSTDDSKSIIERYRHNPHVKNVIYNEVNSGSPFKQWNNGMLLANGELVWIAESDDYCEPDFLARCVDAINGTPNCSYVVAASQLFYEDGHVVNQHFSHKEPYEFVDGKRFISTSMLTGNGVWNASAVVFSKEKALNVDGQYQQYRAAGDRLFWIEMAELGNVAIVPSILNHFRKYKNELSTKCQRDGTTLTEEYDIFKYLVRHHHLRGTQIMKNKYYYLGKIYNATYFRNEEVRRMVLNRWLTIPLFSKIAYKFYTKLLTFEYYLKRLTKDTFKVGSIN